MGVILMMRANMTPIVLLLVKSRNQQIEAQDLPNGCPYYAQRKDIGV
jgi:hypothetical protein